MIVSGYVAAVIGAAGLIMWIVQRVNSARARQIRRKEMAAALQPPSENAGSSPNDFGRG